MHRKIYTQQHSNTQFYASPAYYPPLPQVRRKRSILSIGCTLAFFLFLALLLIGIFSIWLHISTKPAYHYTAGQEQDTHHFVVGIPSLNAAFIHKVLSYYHSPASGKGQVLYDDGIKYNIDPAYALAFFMEESTFGTKGIATVTHSIGNIRATAGQPEYKGYHLYASWEEGFEDWYKLIAQQYVKQRGLTTVDQIIPVYAPGTDNNNEQQYSNAVKWAVGRWRQGIVEIS